MYSTITELHFTTKIPRFVSADVDFAKLHFRIKSKFLEYDNLTLKYAVKYYFQLRGNYIRIN